MEFVTTERLVCKNGHSLVEPPSRVFYTVSVSACLFVGERFFQKVYGRPLPSTSPFTLRTVDRTAGRSFAVVARFGKRCEFGDNCEVCKAFVCQYAPPRSCCSWGPAEAKRCMPAPRRLHWMASVMTDGDVIDAEFALRRCHLSSTERIFFICTLR